MNRNKLFILMYLAIPSFFCGCHARVSGDKLMAYMADPDNGLFQVKKSDRVSMMVQYLPSSYQVWRDIQSGAGYTPSQADSAQKADSRFYYFRLVIRGANSVHDQPHYFDFGIRKELSLVFKNDTIPCLICQHIITGNSRSQEYLLAFPSNVVDGSANRFKYDGIFLFTAKKLGLAPQTFQFTRSDLNKIPGLKI